MSFFSRELYGDVAWQWRGTGLLYLLFLVTAALIPLCARFQIEAVKFAREQGPAIIRQMPKLMLEGGRLSTDPPGRHEIKDPETGKVVMVIDAEAEADMDPEADVTITATHFIVRRESRGEVRAYELRRLDDRTIDHAKLQQWLDVGKFVAPLFMLALLMIIFYVYRVIQALFYSLFALLFMNIRKVTLDYPALLRLVTVAVTPAIVIDVLDDFIPGEIPFLWLICFVISMSYLWFGINAAAVSRPNRDPATTPAPIAS